jgi:hypothetical protein
MKPVLAIFDLLIAQIAPPVHCNEVIDLAEALVRLLLSFDYMDPAHGILDGLVVIPHVVVVAIEPDGGRGFGVFSVGFNRGLTSLILEIWIQF